MKKDTLKIPASHRGDLGFTAIEIAMVAAVIAILSLIAIPIFRNRVEDAKIAAAQADLTSLMKAEQVVKADIDGFARLEDLDNVELFGYTGTPTGGVNKEVPYFKYISPTDGGTPAATRQRLTVAQRNQLAGQPGNPVWRGPYIAFQNAVRYEDIKDNTFFPNTVAQQLLASLNGNDYRRAIQDVTDGLFPDHEDNRIPVDPWGNPYLFFPPTGNASVAGGTNQEFPSAVIYSMGPNGLPGDGSGGAAAYLREYTLTATDDSALGKDDDLMVEF